MSPDDLHAYTDTAAKVFEGVLLTMAMLGSHIEQGHGMMSAAFARGLRAAIARQSGLTHETMAGYLRQAADVFGPDGTLIGGISDAAARSIIFGDSFTGAMTRSLRRRQAAWLRPRYPRQPSRR